MGPRILIKETVNNIGEKVTVAGWVNTRRDHGKLIFIDLRDRSGLVQVVFSSKNEAVLKEADRLRPEWVVAIEGMIKERPESMKNPNLPTGDIEIEVKKITILNEAKTPPFDIDSDGHEISEEHRLKYRYIDLRRSRLQENMKMRHKVVKFIRDYLSKQDFTEIETPILTKSTPEGARDFIVPSRRHKGKFYALPQSPQQYKQLLMAAGFEKYFQIARALRDEDTRGDRQVEHTQLDLEMSFVTGDDVMNLTEELFMKMVETLYPAKKITEKPWPRLSYKEAMEKYRSDKPDIRKDKNDPNELGFAWVIDFPLFELDEENKRYDPVHHMFVMPKEEDISLLDTDPLRALSTQYDWVANGYELCSGSIRIHKRKLQEKIMNMIGLDTEKAEEKFGHLLDALDSGMPPHGGIAPGIDRLMMVLQNEPNIREVIAFPKTGDGRDLMMDAPSQVEKEQLDELGISIKKPKK
ncbi:aspartate--tRNA ligase [Patescibacteria group bacterium]|nr:aspartate--tRNA ligase [Patescibacteria group bacterium]